MFLVLFAYAVFSITFTLGKQAMSYGQPILFVALRMLFAGALLLGYQYFFTKESFIIRKEDRLSFAKIIFFQFYLAYCLQYWALPYVTSTKWALIYTIAPFAAAFFSYFYFKERFTFKKLMGFAVAVIGLMPVLVSHAPDEEPVTAFLFISWPEIAIFLSAVAFAYGLIVTRQLFKKGEYSAIMLNGVSMITCGVLALITSPFIDSWSPSPVSDWSTYGRIVVAISLFNILYYLLNTRLLKTYTVTFLTLVSAIDPLYVALYSWIYLGETVTWKFFVCVALIFTGVYLFYQEELKQGYILA